MTIRFGALAAVVLAAVAGGAACSSSPSGASSFTWSVDSRSYTAVQDGLTYANASQNTFSAFTCRSGQSVSIATASGGSFDTGTYSSPITASTGDASAKDAFTLFINEGLAATSGGPGPFWVAASGSMTITAVEGDHIAGTFDVTLVPSTNSTETGTAHATGSFSVPPFLGTSLCAAEASGS